MDSSMTARWSITVSVRTYIFKPNRLRDLRTDHVAETIYRIMFVGECR